MAMSAPTLPDDEAVLTAVLTMDGPESAGARKFWTDARIFAAFLAFYREHARWPVYGDLVAYWGTLPSHTTLRRRGGLVAIRLAAQHLMEQEP
jgi:hypothetical protein